MKRRAIIALVTLLLACGSAAWKFIPHTLSFDECGDIYRHFADMKLEGVRLSYVRDKVINDTLRLPVTLLEAENSEGWQRLDSLFGCSAQVEAILDIPDLPDSVRQEIITMPFSFYGYRARRESPEKQITPDDSSSNVLFVYVFINRHIITIYESDNPEGDGAAISNRAITNQQEMTQDDLANN